MNNEQKAQSLPSARLVQNGLLSAALSIKEGNILIAEFMGMKFLSTHFDSAGYEQYSYSVSDEISKQVYGYTGATTFLDNQFNTSWDWLMPVLEKISKIEFHREMQDLGDGKIETIIYTHYPRTFGMLNNETGNPMFRYNSCCLFEAETLIEAAWLATVDFIKTLCL